MTREEAIKVIDNRFEIMDYCESAKLEEALDIAIKALEQPERKTGKWLRSGSDIFPCECDWCGDTNERMTPWCPHCGAKMGYYTESEIIAWMPANVPSPYQPKEE